MSNKKNKKSKIKSKVSTQKTAKNNDVKDTDIDNEKTKKVKIPKNKAKKNKDKPKKEHKKLKLVLKIIGILILIGILAVAGVIAGVFWGLFGDDFEITKEDLIIGTSNTVVLDKDGNTIATLAGDEKREMVSLSDMPKYLPEAFIAIEDERFREHNGVDIQRTLYAGIKFILNGGSSSFGGSTITQQLVKNITQDKEDERSSWYYKKS